MFLCYKVQIVFPLLLATQFLEDLRACALSICIDSVLMSLTDLRQRLI
jgi:hypothetical protein